MIGTVQREYWALFHLEIRNLLGCLPSARNTLGTSFGLSTNRHSGRPCWHHFFSQKIFPKFLTLLWTNWTAWEGENFIKSQFMLILLDEGMLSCGSITSIWRTWSSRISRVVFRLWLGCGLDEVLIVFERCYEEGSVSMEMDLDDSVWMTGWLLGWRDAKHAWPAICRACSCIHCNKVVIGFSEFTSWWWQVSKISQPLHCCSLYIQCII